MSSAWSWELPGVTFPVCARIDRHAQAEFEIDNSSAVTDPAGITVQAADRGCGQSVIVPGEIDLEPTVRAQALDRSCWPPLVIIPPVTTV